MKYDDITNKIQQYSEYIKEHRANVARAWEELKIKCHDEVFVTDDWMFECMENSVIPRHDLSKYTAEEFTQYRQYFYSCEFEARNDAEFEKAWEHHYQNNAHHWEHWIDKNTDDFSKCIIARVEMICDWVAMGYKFGDSAYSYYHKNKDSVILDDESRKFVERILNKIGGSEYAE